MTKPVRRQGSAVYYARRVVPKDLTEIVGRREIWKSLGTTDCDAAKPLERRQQSAWDEQFAELRRQRDALKPQASPTPDWSPFRSEEEQDAVAETGRYWDELDAEIEADPVLKAKLRLAAQINAEAEKRELAAFFAEEQASATKTAKQKAAGTPLSVLLERWELGQTNAKTVDRMKAVVAWFEDDMGRIPVEAITPDDIMTWSDKLLAKTSQANARTKLANLNTLLNFAVRKARFVKANPASGISIDVKVDPEEQVQPFDLDALRAIFSSPVYAEGYRPDGGASEAAYWLPLLALFTGARLNELGQLRPKDIATLPYVDQNDEERQAWVIRIIADKAEGLKLKTAWSARRVPIHPELIRLGFLDYVEAMKAEGHTRIFPALRPDKYGTVTANWSKWFGRYLRETCKVTDGRMRFHSFRHAFKDYAREMEIAEDVNDAITGHKGETVARQYGSSLNFPLRPMVNAMAIYRVTGLTLPALSPWLAANGPMLAAAE